MPLPRIALALMAAIAIATVGCSGRKPTYPVTGKVVYKDDGSPAAAGVHVLFESTREPYERSMSPIKSDGTFTLSTDRPGNGAIQGEHRACIQPLAADGSGGDLTPQLSKKIDPKYFELRTSGFKFDIKPSGKNEFVLEVERPKS
jgi:hypothetical protein